MSSRDHERYRRQLEKQLREDVELLYAGYTAKLRAYEALHQLPGEVEAFGPRLLPAADLPLRLPAAELSPSPPPVAPPAPVPPPPPRSRAYQLYPALAAALGHCHLALRRSRRRLRHSPPDASVSTLAASVSTPAVSVSTPDASVSRPALSVSRQDGSVSIPVASVSRPDGSVSIR